MPTSPQQVVPVGQLHFEAGPDGTTTRLRRHTSLAEGAEEGNRVVEKTMRSNFVSMFIRLARLAANQSPEIVAKQTRIVSSTIGHRFVHVTEI